MNTSFKRVASAALSLLLTLPAAAGWDPTKPEESAPTRQSSAIRANWVAITSIVGSRNLIGDSELLLWHLGDTSRPSMYILNGTGGTIARTGRGLADTNRKIGDFAAKLTSGAGSWVDLYQDIILPANYDDGFNGHAFSCGAWMLSSTASAARVCLYDANGGACSSYHTGNGQWQWLTTSVGAVSMDAIAGLQASMRVEAGTLVGYGANLTCVFGAIPPGYAQPSIWIPFGRECTSQGVGTASTDKYFCHWQSPYYGIIDNVSVVMGTGPAGADHIWDLNTWDGAAYTSMYTSGGRPKVLDGATRTAVAPPDGTYARRCVVPQHAGVTVTTGAEVSVDVDQVGVGTAGRDWTLRITGRAAVRPLLPFLAYNQ